MLEPSTRGRVPKLAIATLLASAALVAVAIARVWDFTCDDAFITFRYSRNLVRGIGPTYNVEAPRAEGYTSFLWMATMAVPHLAHADPVAMAKVVGVVLTLLTVAACFGTAWSLCEEAEWNERVLSATLGASLFATYHLTAVHVVSGMETALATFLLSVLAWMAVRDRWAASPAVPCCALLLGLSRPELNLASVTLLVAVFLRIERGQRRRFLTWVALLYVVPGAVYFLWRLSYYGLLLPLPFYVKAATLTPRGLTAAAHFGAEAAICFGVFLALSLADLRPKSVSLFAVVLVVGLYLLFPEHVMGYGHRFFHPLVPLTAALSARGAAFVLSALRGRLGPRRVAVPYIGFLVLGLAPVCSRYAIVWGECAQYARGWRTPMSASESSCTATPPAATRCWLSETPALCRITPAGKRWTVPGSTICTLRWLGMLSRRTFSGVGPHRRSFSRSVRTAFCRTRRASRRSSTNACAAACGTWVPWSSGGATTCG